MSWILSTPLRLQVARTYRSVFWSKKRRRCDPQSMCAQCARRLLEELSQQTEAPANFQMALYFSSQDAAAWSTGQYLRLTEGTRRALLQGTILDHGPRLLETHRCSVVALETIWEAMQQIKHNELQYEPFYGMMLQFSPSFSTWGSLSKEERDSYLMFWLHVLELHFAHAPYVADARVATPEVARVLAWFLPQHMGRGMESLKALHSQRHKVTDSSCPVPFPPIEACL